MYSGNKEYFALKRQLIDEAKIKLGALPCESYSNKLMSSSNVNEIDVKTDQSFNSHFRDIIKRRKTTKTNATKTPITFDNCMDSKKNSSTSAFPGLTFVYEWYDNNENIFGYGCNSSGVACCVKPNVMPGLFVITSNVPVLREICSLHGYRIEIYDIMYKANNFAIWDLFSNPNVATECYLVKIITTTVVEAIKLYSNFKYNKHSYKYVGVPLYYDVTKQILFELLILRVQQQINANISNIDYTVPDTVMHWFDENLNIYGQFAAPQIPIITFDIETVSDDPHRVPTGDAIQDVLYSVSIHHTHTNILYSLIYLPLRGFSEEMLHDKILNDGYDMVPDKKVDNSQCKNNLECFSNEYDLLKRTMDLLTLGNKLHILLGYNSISYDIKYLLIRCVFYNIYVDKFIWREGYSFGIEQMHLDLFRIIVMRYRFKSYTLNEVSRSIMKDSKTGVSAVALRYTFFKMLKTQKFLNHNESNEKLPSIRDTLHYNNADTLLVSKLESRTRSIEFVIQRAMACQVPLSAMTTNYNKMQYKLWNECFVVGLNMKIFLTTFKSDIADIKCPFVSNYSQNDTIDLVLNLSDKLNANDKLMNCNVQPPSTVLTSNMNNDHQIMQQPQQQQQQQSLLRTRYASVPDKKAKFPGGANFCLGEINADNVQMYDYVTAYPLLMDRKNISDETLTIFPASILLMLYPKIQNHHEFKTYDYLAHSGLTKTETIILYYQYIYDGLYCGGEFPFIQSELYRRHDSPVIIIWEGRRGVLSEIVAKFNETRAKTKIMRKTLDEAYTLVEEKIQTLIEQKQMIDELTAITSADGPEIKEIAANDDLNGDFGLFGFDDDSQDGDVNNDTDRDNNVRNVNNNDTDCYEKRTENDISDANFGFDDSDNDHNDDDIANFGYDVDDNDDGNDNSANNNITITASCMNDIHGLHMCKHGDHESINVDGDDDDVVVVVGGGDVPCQTNNTGCKYDDWSGVETGSTMVNHKCNCICDKTNNDNNNSRQQINCARLSNAADLIYTIEESKIKNPFHFEFVNKYITVYENQMCVINNDELYQCSDAIKCLEEILDNIMLERSKISNSYDLQKSIVSSIYGCVGKMIPVVAAGITCMTRNALLASAQYCRSLNYEVLYLDTDSIMITGCAEDLSSELNRRFPHMEMEMKVARKCMFVKRKTYYKFDDGILKYGQNVNGPNSWRLCVEYFNSQDNISTNDDIYASFYQFYINAYLKLKSFKTVCPEFLELFTQTIKTKDEYKTMTVAAKFKSYLSNNYPAIAGSNKHKIFYYLENTVMMPCLRPELDIKSIDDIRNVNLFKYYQNMFTTIFNLIKFHIRKNNEPYKVTISSKYVLLIMLKAYLDVYEYIFSTNLVDKPTIVETTDADEIFCEKIYEETLYDSN
ncbi:DNA polymerase B [Mauternbach virus]|uniref:DNA polymerase n=1 Tax=Mauternbach virus TaxID=2486603 RepID=A0A3G3E5Z7_9VIRU|nr:DNA polymerase B [Mauternbach virus]AYP97892.1 DNA polymerase B [Mauternbach virus]